jgi:isopentenyl diphosphate isomerase/L-lactate dehydrogenase-like FMN-dependent dehydrogenase
MGLDVPVDTVENAVDKLLNVADYERVAEQVLDPGAYGYYAGGAGDEITLRANVEAYRRLRLRPRALADVTGVSTRATVLGHDVSMPLCVAPVAFQRLAHPDGEVAAARAAARAGTIY